MESGLKTAMLSGRAGYILGSLQLRADYGEPGQIPPVLTEVFTARLRPEDASRDTQQRLGMEERRARTQEPLRRTFQVQLVARTWLRLIEQRLERTWGPGSWGANRRGIRGNRMPHSWPSVPRSGGIGRRLHRTCGGGERNEPHSLDLPGKRPWAAACNPEH